MRGYFLFLTGGKPSGKEVKRRQDTFEEKPGSTIQQVKAMSLLDDKSFKTCVSFSIKNKANK